MAPGFELNYNHDFQPADPTVAKVKLRLHFSGQFVKVGELQQWRYCGGEVFNEGIQVTSKYADLCRKLNDKFGDTVSFKYQAPGDELDPEALVAVTDDSDLQELYDEYFQALSRPGTPLKTFRIKVFVFPALQFETVYEQPAMDEVDSSYLAQEGGEINFDSWCSDDVSYSSNPSLNQGLEADTQLPPPVVGQPGNPVLGLNHAAAKWWPPQAQRQEDSQAGSASAAMATGHAGATQLAAVPGATAQCPKAAAELEYYALNNLNTSITRHIGFPQAGDSEVPGVFREHLFQIDDPYHEQDEELQFSAMPQCYFEQVPAAAAKVADTEQDEADEHLSNKPLNRVRDAIFSLPAHISVFGDPGQPSGADQSQPGSIKLPSHISAFGEGLELPEGMLTTQDGMEMEHGHDKAIDAIMHGQGAEMKPHGSKVITQEFYLDGSLLAQQHGGHVNYDINFQLQADTTPPALRVLEVVARVPKSDVQITRKIGEGAFGEVSEAQVFPYGTVAVKWLKKDRFAKYSESFQREAEVLAKLNHPNIIRMYGLVTEAEAAGSSSSVNENQLIAGIMTEYVRGGSLTSRLRQYAAEGRRLSLHERCLIACQATLGMAYLHDQNPAVIHFDLKPDNLLVGEEEGERVHVKVADFGLSKHKFQNYVSCRDLRGTLPYMAPELVSNPNQVCEKCDVWSMGVVMWEMYTLEVPFQELSAQHILMGLMHGNLHLHIPSSCEPEWRGLVEACMEPNPDHRPSFNQLARHLQSIIKQLQQQQQQPSFHGQGSSGQGRAAPVGRGAQLWTPANDKQVAAPHFQGHPVNVVRHQHQQGIPQPALLQPHGPQDPALWGQRPPELHAGVVGWPGPVQWAA